MPPPPFPGFIGIFTRFSKPSLHASSRIVMGAQFSCPSGDPGAAHQQWVANVGKSTPWRNAATRTNFHSMIAV